MDGGAYCTLTPVVLSPRRDPRRRPVPLPERPDPRPGDADEHAAERRVPRLRRAAGRVRRRDPARPHRRGARDVSPLEIRRRNVYRLGDTTPTGQVLRESVAGEEVLERAAEAAEFERRPGADGADARRGAPARASMPGSPLRTGRDRIAQRDRARARLARRRVHRLGRGQARVGRVARARPPTAGSGILTGSTEMGQGTKTIFPQLVADGARRARSTTVEIAPQDTAFVPDSGPTVASRTAMVVGGLLIKAARRLRGRGRGARPAAPFADDLPRRTPRRTARPASTSSSSRTRASTSTTRRTAATPTRRSAGRPASRRVDVDLDTGEVHGPRRRRRRRRRARSSTRSWPRARSRAARSRRSATRRSRRSSCATAATSTTGSRPTSSRPRSTRRGSRRSSSRRRSAARRTAPRGSASCRWTSGRRRSSPRSTTRPASGSTTCRPARSGSSPRSPARPAARRCAPGAVASRPSAGGAGR